MLMQLAENIQRENLTLEEECDAIAKLYKMLGSLEKVANIVRKSKPWCSKRYAMTQKTLAYQARDLLESGITEDIELLKALSSLIELISWSESNIWIANIKAGKAGRNEIRAALKEAKAAALKEVANEKAAQKTKKVSHAKPRTPPPPPPWTVEDGIENLSEALSYVNANKSATELLYSWTEEQRMQIDKRLNQAWNIGASEDGFKIIGKLVMQGLHGTPYTDIDLMAMIEGCSGRTLAIGQFLDALQCPREKA